MIIRRIGKYSGAPRISEVELILMNRYYICLVINSVVLTGILAGFTSNFVSYDYYVTRFMYYKVVDVFPILDTASTPSGPVFWMTYMVTTSLIGASCALLQVNFTHSGFNSTLNTVLIL